MKSRTQIRVLEPFTDPYTGQQYGEGQVLDKDEMKQTGWQPADFKAAISSNLVKEELITNG